MYIILFTGIGDGFAYNKGQATGMINSVEFLS